LENIKYSRNSKEIIKGVTINFEDNKITSIIGSNGVGKSTLAYIIMGLSDYKPNYGKIYLDDKDITDFSITERARLGISLLWQEPARFEGLTVKDYLSLGGKIKLDVIKDALNLVRLNPDVYLSRYVDKKLSGGERKRVEIASCILLKPKFLIMDEPDSGIDLMSLDMIVDIMKYLKDNGTGVIVITHREEIATHSDYSYLICDGKVLKSGVCSDIIDYYRSTCDLCDNVNAPKENLI
ncbi:MAG: ATP-binding cassette domain-containing protein, partial [Desulfurella sp.]|uniref:ATP-binding cassette domain-containing protein n=1 Tax=Desulfurella sp. TaxID=1962857 RepID=UPI003D108347